MDKDKFESIEVFYCL